MSAALRIVYCDPSRCTAELRAGVEARVLVDCREAFTDPTPWARLIESSPEMRVALRDLVYPDPNKSWIERVDRARALLAKIDGA